MSLLALSYDLGLVNLAVRLRGDGHWRSARALPADQTAPRGEDAELVARHLAGDPNAFAELVRRYTRVIYNVTFRFTGDAHEAENLTQETFLKVWHVLPRLKLDKPFKPYFVKVAVNLCRDWAAQRKLEMPLEDESQPELAADVPDLPDWVSDQELRERVRTGLGALPPLYRTILTLRYNEDMSYDELATALDLPLNTVRTQLRRAKAHLREQLAQR